MTHPKYPEFPYPEDWRTDPATTAQNRPANHGKNRAEYARLDLTVIRARTALPKRCENHTPIIVRGTLICTVCGATAPIA